MSDVLQAMRDVVVANRILSREGVVDAYGHVTVRHPDNPERYLMSCSRAPELVTLDDIMEFTLDGEPVDDSGRVPYAERFIHGAIYEKRPDVNSVVHNHSHAVIPFGVTGGKAASDHPCRGLDRRGYSGLGHPRQVRRHQPAGGQHGAGPRPRGLPRRQPGWR